MDTKPAEADNAEVNKDNDEIRCVDIAEVEEDEDYKADDPDYEEGGDPDESGVDVVVVGGADSDNEVLVAIEKADLMRLRTHWPM